MIARILMLGLALMLGGAARFPENIEPAIQTFPPGSRFAAPDCIAEPYGQRPPPARTLYFPAYGASLNRPVAVEFVGGSSLGVEPLFLDGPLRVVVSVRAPTGERTVVCDTGFTKFNVLATLRIAHASPRPQAWRVEVFEANPDLDGRSPPALAIDGGPIERDQVRFEPGRRPDFGEFDFEGRRPSPLPACRLLLGALPPGVRLEPSRPAVQVEDRFEIPQRVRFVAGHRAYVRLTPAVGGGRLRVTLLARGMGPAVPACSLLIDPRTAPKAFIAAVPPWEDTFDREWLVQLEQAGATPLTEVRIETFREHDPLAQERSALGNTPASAMCPGKTQWIRMRSPLAEGIRFAAARSIRVSLAGDGLTLDREARQSIVEALLESLRTWRSICQHCGDQELAVAEIDGELYGLPGLIGKDGLIGNFPPPQRGEVFFERPDWQKIGPRGGGAKGYEEVRLSNAQRDRICTTPPRPGDIYRAAGTALCGAEPAGDDLLVIDLVVRAGRLNCSNDPNVVGCWDGTSLIELNGRDYRFYLMGPEAPVFGDGPRLVDLTRVLSHEVGHWHGLGHMAGGGASIMNGKLAAAECADPATIARFNDITLGKAPAFSGVEHLEYK